MIYLYVLQSLLDKDYYIGITKNIESRLEKHNKGGVNSTRKRKPFKLVFKEEFQTYAEARKREVEIKAFKGGNKFRELLS